MPPIPGFFLEVNAHVWDRNDKATGAKPTWVMLGNSDEWILVLLQHRQNLGWNFSQSDHDVWDLLISWEVSLPCWHRQVDTLFVSLGLKKAQIWSKGRTLKIFQCQLLFIFFDQWCKLMCLEQALWLCSFGPLIFDLLALVVTSCLSRSRRALDALARRLRPSTRQITRKVTTNSLIELCGLLAINMAKDINPWKAFNRII